MWYWIPTYNVQTSFAIFISYLLPLRIMLLFRQWTSDTSAFHRFYIPTANSSRPKQLKNTPQYQLENFFYLVAATMKQHHREQEKTDKRRTLDPLCSGSGLLLSVVCCIALIHAELRIQEHHRLISHSVTFCKSLETEILRKVQQNYKGWLVKDSGRHWQATKGTLLAM